MWRHSPDRVILSLTSPLDDLRDYSHIATPDFYFRSSNSRALQRTRWHMKILQSFMETGFSPPCRLKPVST
jgi:hypothetical protein